MRSNLTPEKRIDKHGRLVTRHVRQDAASASQTVPPIPAPMQTKIASQVTAEAVYDGLQARRENGSPSNTKTNTQQNRKRDEISATLASMFPQETMNYAAEVLESSLPPETTRHMLRGLIECAELRLDGNNESYTEMMTLRTITRVEQARVLAYSGSHEYERQIQMLISRVENQTRTVLMEAANRGLYSNGIGLDSEEYKCEVAALLVNLVSPITAREAKETPRMYEHLLEIHENMDRILPFLQEFQKRGNFSFGVLDEMESAGTQPLHEGVL